MRKKVLLCSLVILCLTPALFLFFRYENHHLVTTEYDVPIDGLHEGLEGYRIVQLSDLHNATFGQDNEKLLEAIRRAKPNILVVTGDYVDRRHTDLEVSLSLGRELVKICPVYYVCGNHELQLPQEVQRQFMDDLRDIGFVVLWDETRNIYTGGTVFALTGLWDDHLVGETAQSVLGRVPQDFLKILLAHEPQHLEEYAKMGADLVFSGHAHGGQFRLPFVGGVFAPGQGLLPMYDCGVYSSGETQMIVSRGLGNSAFPIRLFNYPEVVVVTLKGA